MTGVVSAKIPARGFFFIRDENGQERFSHANNLANVDFKQLREGARVTFEPIEIPGKGLRADCVVVVDATS